MGVTLLTEHLGFVSLEGGRTDLPESTLVNCHIIGNHMSRLNYGFILSTKQLED